MAFFIGGSDDDDYCYYYELLSLLFSFVYEFPKLKKNSLSRNSHD